MNTFNNPLPEDVDTVKFIKESFSSEVLHDENTYFLLFDLVYRLISKNYYITLQDVKYGVLLKDKFNHISENKLSYFSYKKLFYTISKSTDLKHIQIELNE